jgi:hypothetical protein
MKSSFNQATMQQGSTRRLLSTAFGRRAPMQTQGSCSPGVRPTLTFEDEGTSKPTSCTEFCAQIKSISPVSTNLVNFVIADHSVDFNKREIIFEQLTEQVGEGENRGKPINEKAITTRAKPSRYFTWLIQ